MFGKLMSVSDELMARYYTLLLGVTLDPAIHPMEAKKSLAEQLTARYHDHTEATAARTDWDTRFSKKDLTAADLPEITISSLPSDLTVLSITAYAFKNAFNLEKSNGELRKQFIITGSVQLNGEKLTDPTVTISLTPGDTLKLSKKHAVRFI
jgi:tyrosyl-tRNA synthetase